jgi:putative DNA primase/helicase
MHWTGESFKNVVKIIRNERPERMVPVKQSDDTAKNIARIEGIKKCLRPLNGECIASLYLAKRGLTVLPEKDVYFHPGVEYWVNGAKSIHPAMVSIFRNLEGKGATFHVTYLSTEGKKAEVESPKKILPVVLPLPGCAIQMFKPVNGVLAVSEGIETALAVNAAEGLPVWAAGNAGNLAAMELPGDLKELWIYADVDPGFAGQQAAYTLARSASNKKKYPHLEKIRVVMQQFSGDVNIITDDGNKLDFLDALLLQGQCSASQASAT